MHRVTPTRFDFASASRSSRVFAGMAEDILERRIVEEEFAGLPTVLRSPTFVVCDSLRNFVALATS
jgi:hypothetical protein